VRAHHYRIVDPEGQMYRRRYSRLQDARKLALDCGHFKIAAMNEAGKVLRYLPVNPKAGR
jgi:hypothetical protein